MSLRGAIAVSALFFVGLAAGEAGADPSGPAGATGAAAAPARVTLAAAPLFGSDAGGPGWTEIGVRVEGVGASAVKGTLEVSAGSTWYGSSSDAHFVARAPFHVQPHAQAVLRIPVRASGYGSPSITVTALAEDGAKLAETSTSISTNVAPLLVDVDEPSRLSIQLRGWPTSPSWRPSSAPYVAPGTTTPLGMGSTQSDPATGDALLPERAVGYAPASAVLVPSDQLARLQGAELDALLGWVLSGGTLAVFPDRPEDLRAGTLVVLAGGAVHTTAAPPVMMTLPGAVRGVGVPPPPPLLAPPGGAVPPPTTPTPPSPATPHATDAGPGATPIGWFLPVRTTPVAPATPVGPSAALRPRLVGYAGGNLRPTAYGATASYGLGQVHVLGFDPTTSPGLDDPWVHARMLDLVGDAWERRAMVAFPQGGGQRTSNLYEVHRALDPNENFRPALGIAAILLVLYSIAAGPLTFMRAHKKGRPLDPLVWAPMASALCFGLIVVVGLAGKGWSGRARRLSLVEAGAGASRGSVKRFRGFFSSQTRSLRVRASDASSVVELASIDSRDQGAPELRLDKDGATLEELTSLPWQTVVVSEDSFADLGGGVAVHEQGDGTVVVANHTGRELRNVVAWAPRTGASWFGSIADGAAVGSATGRALFTASARPTATAGARTVHELYPSALLKVLADGHDVVTRWSALADASGPATDWWPDDVPVVMGEIAGGDGVTNDSGLRVESSVVLLRVVGEGGAT